MAPASKGGSERGGAVDARRHLARRHGGTHGGRSQPLLLPVLELVTLLGLNLEDVARLERERLVRGHQVAAHLAQAGGLERGRVVSACREECGEGAGCRKEGTNVGRGKGVRGGVRGGAHPSTCGPW